MRSLEARLSRLEKKRKAKSNRAPSLAEYLDASFRQRTRRLYSAKSRLMGEDRVRRNLSERDQNFLSNDTPEQREKDADVEERWERVHGPSAEETAAHAEDGLRELRSLVRAG